MRPTLLTLLAVLALGWLPGRGKAVILEVPGALPGKPRRVTGYLVRETDRELVVRLEGGDREEQFSKDQVQVVSRVDLKRLEALRPGDPKAYRDCAEDLAAKREDPEARETAVRLFLIAAALDPEHLGRGSLLAMSALADTEMDRRKWLALAYLLDPRHDLGLLKPAGPARPTDRDTRDKPSADPARTAFLRCLRSYRRGQTADALREAQTPGVAELFARTPGLLPHQQFLDSCRNHPVCSRCSSAGEIPCSRCLGSGGNYLAGCPKCQGSGAAACSTCNGQNRALKLTDDELRVMARIELRELGEQTASNQAIPGSNTWTAVLGKSNPAPLPALSLNSATRFNPRQCVFRGGVWVEP